MKTLTVGHERRLSERVEMDTDVHQRCVLSPTLFLIILDAVMRKVIRNRKMGILWGLQKRLRDVDFANVICMMSQCFTDIGCEQGRLCAEAGLVSQVTPRSPRKCASNLQFQLLSASSELQHYIPRKPSN